MQRSRFLLPAFLLLGVMLSTSPLLAGEGEKDKPRKCILVFGAHADDVDEIAGGTFARYIADGYQGVYVCVTNNTAGCNIEKALGDKGGPSFSVSQSPRTYPADALETNQIREIEARAAAAVYGATPVFLNFDEPELFLGRKLAVYGTKEFLKFRDRKSVV